VADYPGPPAHDPGQPEDDADITTDELARFIAELTDTRGLNQWQQDRIEELTRELAAAKVDTGYQCHDCEALRADLSQTQQALDEAADLLASERIQRVQTGLELRNLQVHCDQLSKLLDNTTLQLAAAQSAAVASHVSRSAPPAVLSGEYREPSPLSPRRPPFTLSSPTSAIPVSAQAASRYASSGISARGGSATVTALASFGKVVDGEIKKSFRKMGTAALKDPSVRSRVVAHLITSLAEPTDGSTTQPAAAAATTAAPTRVNAVDVDFIRSLERQFAEAEKQHRPRG
jgi:hypothetical protein